MRNAKKHRDIKLITTEKKKLWYHTNLSYYKVFHEKFIGYRNEKNSNSYE